MSFANLPRSSATVYFFLFILLSVGLSTPCLAHMTKNSAGQLVPCPDEAAGRPCTSDHWTVDLRMPGSSVEGACTGSSEADVERRSHYYTDDHSWDKISQPYCDTGSRQITEPPRSLAKKMLLDNILLQTDDARDRIHDAIKTFRTAAREENPFEAAGGSVTEYAGALKDAVQKLARLTHMLNDLHGAVTQDMLDQISQSEDDLNKSVGKMQSTFDALPVGSRVALGAPRPPAPQPVAATPPPPAVTTPPPPAASSMPADNARPDKVADKGSEEALAQLTAALGHKFAITYNTDWREICEFRSDSFAVTEYYSTGNNLTFGNLASPPGRWTCSLKVIDVDSIQIYPGGEPTQMSKLLEFKASDGKYAANGEQSADPKDLHESPNLSVAYPDGMSVSDAQNLGKAFIAWVRAAQKKGK